MSVTHDEDVMHDAGNETPAEPPAKVSHKSFRRKYRKIMVKFEKTMRESSNLFQEEQRVLDISRRLSEQNDQLLELLHDLNRCPHVPSHLRFDIASTKRQPGVEEEPIPSYDSNSASAALIDARHKLRSGEVSLSEYQRTSDQIAASSTFAPQKSYISMLDMRPPANRFTAAQDGETSRPAESGYPSSTQEDQYLQGLDAYLAGSASHPREFARTSIARPGERSVEKDRDMAVRNPVSVYNWLRKHQPQVFLQDNELNSEKPAKTTGSRASKRASVAIKQEPELYDDDGIAMDMGATSRGKRKRDDDGGYRPKGGNSRPAKRKKDEGPISGKKTRMSSFGGTVAS